eukprot:2655721-Karenia_brevis.AAC.1
MHLSGRGDLDQLVADALRPARQPNAIGRRVGTSRRELPPREVRDDVHVLMFDGGCEGNPGPASAGA